MKVLETLGEEFCELRRREDVYALSRSLECLDNVVRAGPEGYAPEGRQYRDIGYLLDLGLVRQEPLVIEELSQVRYYPTTKGLQTNLQLEKIGKKGIPSEDYSSSGS